MDARQQRLIGARLNQVAKIQRGDRSVVGIPKMSDCIFDSDTADSPDIEWGKSDIQGRDPSNGEGVAHAAPSRCGGNAASPVVYNGIRLESLKYRLVGPPMMKSRELGHRHMSRRNRHFQKNLYARHRLRLPLTHRRHAEQSSVTFLIHAWVGVRESKPTLD